MTLVQVLAIVVILAIAYRKEIVSLFRKMKEHFKSHDYKWLKPIGIGLAVVAGIVVLVLLFKFVYWLVTWAFPGDFGEFVGFLAAIVADIFVAAVVYMAGTEYWNLPF